MMVAGREPADVRTARVVLKRDASARNGFDPLRSPTGAKGMNLAISDVVLLADALRALLLDHDETLLDAYSETAQQRIWNAQHFSW